MSETDQVTRDWMRNRSDELAVESGCRFDLMRGAAAVTWIERFARLYEGRDAGRPLILRGCFDCEYDIDPTFNPAANPKFDWRNTKQITRLQRERAERHVACIAAGHRIDWQYDTVMRIFGWIRYKEFLKRWVRRFRQAIIFVAKKNKKSPTAAAIGLYLLIGDGEPGQKVFIGAKDGGQARRIIGEHSRRMVELSPKLKSVCRYNKTTGWIYYERTMSAMGPLSSNNIASQQSKEGINGSLVIDEIHVVDWTFMRTIDRAGISRDEPLHIEVSTAGDDPQGYGRHRFDYALQVIDGAVHDIELFAAVYAAPQDLADADLDADPLRYGRMANPSMGHTIDPDEFLSDYQRSKRTSQGLADFRRYRLNIWTAGACPWLRMADWEACRDDFTAEDLYGRSCIAALDLSKTRDMTSLVLVFDDEEDEEAFLLLPTFWLPEAAIDELELVVPAVRDWVAGGYLRTTPGNVVDYGVVESDIREMASLFMFRELVFDPYRASEITQRISEGQFDRNGNCVVEGLGIPRFSFAQTLDNFADPTDVFERAVLSHKLRHNGHPILTWQAGHVRIMRTLRGPTQRRRPVKPTENSRQTIDGIVASIMGIARLRLAANDGGYGYPSVTVFGH